MMYENLERLSDQELAERAQHTITALINGFITPTEARERIQRIIDEGARRG
jgi:hypothetical protein